jgi:hypothetical protein
MLVEFLELLGVTGAVGSAIELGIVLLAGFKGFELISNFVKK